MENTQPAFQPAETYKMNPEVKALWLSRLRDPNVKQGPGALKTRDGSYCCLGLLCEIHKEVTGGPEWGTTPLPEKIYMGQLQVLPTEVMEWAGLRTSFGSTGQAIVIEGEAIAINLTSLNDGLYHGASVIIRPHSFPEIADFIEANL